ncbi:ABC transporter ATP-binding protein [Fructilactobacillus sp. Tb1]|uniref:ABC transporter ATP-binding protein n=1 Tax=Fructilactobacillus sp. Tb1 TaxID=3422304 RepID=UPI003D2BC388
MNNLLNFEDVSYERADKQILTDINWKVAAKENWAILGLNGAGKTTLLKMIHGDIWPTTGKISVLGHKFGETNIPALQRKIGWVSTALQDVINVGDKVDDIVLSGKFASIGIYQEFTQADVAEAKQMLIRVGGEKLIGKTYRVLSQGERQLVLIARALMAKPELLILDEPCNGLDLLAREKLLQRIAMINDLPDSPAMLMVSHHTEELLPCFDHLLLLKQGQIYQKGTRKDLLNEGALSDFYGTPVTMIKHKEKVIVYPK